MATVVCENTAPEFPIMIGFPQAYEFPVEEVYLITEVQKTAKELVGALGEKTKTFHPIIWTNEFKGCKVFGTSIGHSTVTYSDEQYLDLVSSGLLWTDDRLQD